MLKVVIATKSSLKISGISEAFRKFFPEEKVVIETVNSSSEVEEQPINDNIFIGAQNRLKNAKELSIDYDFIISCESGLLQQFSKWFNVQIVYMENSNGKIAWAISNGFEIPEKYIQEIKETNLKEVLDKLFEGTGGISILSNGLLSRSRLIEEATIVALSKFNWPI